jgi:hypothetical protein
MSSLIVAPALFAGCLLAGLLGLALRQRLAEHHLDNDSRAVVTNITGLIAAMSALLLGLLVANAQSSYNTVSDEVDQIAANMVEIDRALASYGPAAAEARALLRQVATAEVDRIWPPDGGAARADAIDPTGTEAPRMQLLGLLSALPTQTDVQRSVQRHVLELLAANGRLRVLVMNQVNNDLPLPIVLIVSFWLVTLFLAFGLLARFNLVVVASLVIGSASVGGAMFLVLELNRPLGGIMQIDDGSPRAALMLMGK